MNGGVVSLGCNTPVCNCLRRLAMREGPTRNLVEILALLLRTGRVDLSKEALPKMMQLLQKSVSVACLEDFDLVERVLVTFQEKCPSLTAREPSRENLEQELDAVDINALMEKINNRQFSPFGAFFETRRLRQRIRELRLI